MIDLFHILTVSVAILAISGAVYILVIKKRENKQ